MLIVLVSYLYTDISVGARASTLASAAVSGSQRCMGPRTVRNTDFGLIIADEGNKFVA